MLTKDFIKKVEKLGLEVDEGVNMISIYDGNDEIAYVYKDKRFCAGTYCEFSECLEELQAKLYNLMDEYARIPIEDREEPQKFYLKLIGSKNNRWNYLNYNTINDFLELDSEKYKSYAETQFTDKELDKLREKFGITFNDFEQIPVGEVEEWKWLT